MKLRRLLSLLLAMILCVTVALSVISCGDDAEETTAETTVAPEGEGEAPAEGGEEAVVEDGGEEAVG
jgi:hypothetical protein